MNTDPMDEFEDAEEAGWGKFAVGHAACPQCGEQIPVPVLARFYEDDEGKQRLETQPEMAELWAHSWTHSGEGVSQ